jgi:hypothetical protein
MEESSNLNAREVYQARYEVIFARLEAGIAEHNEKFGRSKATLDNKALQLQKNETGLQHAMTELNTSGVKRKRESSGVLGQRSAPGVQSMEDVPHSEESTAVLPKQVPGTDPNHTAIESSNAGATLRLESPPHHPHSHVSTPGADKSNITKEESLFVSQQESPPSQYPELGLAGQSMTEQSPVMQSFGSGEVKMQSPTPGNQTLSQSFGNPSTDFDASVQPLEYPRWYDQMSTTQITYAEREKQKAITYLRLVYRDVQETVQAIDKVGKLRCELWSLRYIPMTVGAIKSKKGLHLLKQIVENDSIPWDIRCDARMIFKDWAAVQFDTDFLHGITSHSGVEKDYEYKVDYHPEGHNGLEVGQWWPLQICAFRDGAHGKTQAGIATNSIIISHKAEYPDDKDYGDTIWYSGTLTKNKSKIEDDWGTKQLLSAIPAMTPQRVLRKAADKPGRSTLLPARGLRYDGLYIVVGVMNLDKPDKTVHLFELKRLPNQPPIRSDGDGARPNTEDLARLAKMEEKKKANRKRQ